MTTEEIDKLAMGDLGELTKLLMTSDYPNLPKWTDLIKEYEPKLHKIVKDLATYPPKLNEKGADDFKRTPLGLQKLAVNRLSQSMFSNPVSMIPSYDFTSDSQKKAYDIFEYIYTKKNSMDSENIERAKKLNATCQIVTIWYSYKKDNIVKGEKTSLELKHFTYCEKDGYSIYPKLDIYGNLETISVSYKKNNVDYLETYTQSKHYRLKTKDGKWIMEDGFPVKIDFMPCVYANIPEPVWGGQDGTTIVEQLEELISFQGMYIKRNSAPTFTLDMGETSSTEDKNKKEDSQDVRRIIRVGKNGKMADVTWAGAPDSIKNQYSLLRNSFFEQVQIPDISFQTLINSNTSAENKELVFMDCRAKAKDLGGEWESLLAEEVEIVKNFIKTMFPKYANDLDQITISFRINPYTVNSDKDMAEYISKVGDNMSLETKVALLAKVPNIVEEVDRIKKEISASNNGTL